MASGYADLNSGSLDSFLALFLVETNGQKVTPMRPIIRLFDRGDQGLSIGPLYVLIGALQAEISLHNGKKISWSLALLDGRWALGGLSRDCVVTVTIYRHSLPLAWRQDLFLGLATRH